MKRNGVVLALLMLTFALSALSQGSALEPAPTGTGGVSPLLQPPEAALPAVFVTGGNLSQMLREIQERQTSKVETGTCRSRCLLISSATQRSRHQ